MANSVGEQRGARVLYVTYDGLTDPLGRSQIMPYLAGLAAAGHRITILSCEKPERMQKDGEQLRGLCADLGLHWYPLKYHKKPPILSSAFDAAILQRAAIKLRGEQPFDIVHCRSYIPGRVGLALKRKFGVRFLFDMRGFWPDEKAEGGNWNIANPLFATVYRYFKRLESRLLRGADHIVSLTEAGKTQLQTRPEVASRDVPITVIPCCVDFDHFPLANPALRGEARKQLGIPANAPVLAYLGSLGSWYMLDEMLAFFKVFASRHRTARFLFVTLDDPQPIRRTGTDQGVDPKMLVIHPASRDDVPRLMAAADVGIFFIRPVFSKIASSPTKMGEMLAIGLPIVANSGVGDVGQMIEEMGCGVAVEQFAPEAYARALDGLDMAKGSAEARRDRARPSFDVALGIEQYDRIYRKLLA